MVPSILLAGQPSCISLWWDFCCRVCFREAFSFFCATLLLFFFFHLPLFDGVGICRTSLQPDVCSTRPCFRLAQVQHKNASCSGGILLKRMRVRRQAINLDPPRRVRALGDGPLRLEDTGLGASDKNDSYLESMSDGLHRLPPETDTWPDLGADKYGQPACVLFDGVRF